MEDDELLMDIKQSVKRSRTTFESTINKKNVSSEELEELFNCW